MQLGSWGWRGSMLLWHTENAGILIALSLVYSEEPQKEIIKKSSAGGRTNFKHWIPKLTLQKSSNLIEFVLQAIDENNIAISEQLSEYSCMWSGKETVKKNSTKTTAILPNCAHAQGCPLSNKTMASALQGK